MLFDWFGAFGAHLIDPAKGEGWTAAAAGEG